MALTERSLVTVRAVLPSLARNARRPPFPAGRFPGRSPAPAPPGRPAAGALRLRRRGGQRQERRQQRQRGAGRAAPPRTDLPDTTTHTECHGSHGTCPKRDRHHRQIRRIEMQANSQDLSKICQRGSQRSTTAGPAGCERPAARQPAPPADKAGPDCKFIHKFGTEPAGTRARLAVRSRHFASATRAFVHHDQIHPPHTRRRHRQLLRGVLHSGPEPELFLQAADRERRPARGARRTACPAQELDAIAPADRARILHAEIAPLYGADIHLLPQEQVRLGDRSETSSPAWAWSFAKTTASISFPCPASRRNGCRCANPATALPTGCWRGAHGCS